MLIRTNFASRLPIVCEKRMGRPTEVVEAYIIVVEHHAHQMFGVGIF